MAKDPAGVFRTKVRVKAKSDDADDTFLAERPPAPVARPRSLMEALKEAARPAAGPAAASSARSRPGEADARPPASAAAIEPRPARAMPASEPPKTPRQPRPGASRAGRLAASRLRQLQRLKDAAAGLESLARGEIEEATVEIIRHDGSRPASRGRTPDLPSKR